MHPAHTIQTRVRRARVGIAALIHDENLRGETWRYIGIAQATGADGVQYWVLNFGTVAGDPNAAGP